jgi:lipoprotein-anchoring transpeptidase ErfK/SrfK
MTKRIKISFYNDKAEGNLTCVGLGRTFQCLGKSGERYPTDLTVNPDKKGVKKHPHYSGEFSCPPNDNSLGQCRLDYAILIWGQRGIYIHAWHGMATYAGNGNKDTEGCIHLSKRDAKIVYDWVDTRTRVTISYPW